jgi:hypothetical protein
VKDRLAVEHRRHHVEHRTLRQTIFDKRDVQSIAQVQHPQRLPIAETVDLKFRDYHASLASLLRPSNESAQKPLGLPPIALD